MAAIPLADVADCWVRALADATGAARMAEIDGATLLGERAVGSSLRIPGTVSAGGGCRLLECRDGAIAINLARAADRDLVPAWLQLHAMPQDDELAAILRTRHAMPLVERGREMGLAIAAERDASPAGPVEQRVNATSAPPALPSQRPRVLDLSALWAGPLAAHLLWQAGAEVVKVESRGRPDSMREGDPALFALINQHKASVLLDPREDGGRRALLSLIARSDIVVEAARPRALAQLGIDVAGEVGRRPGLVWVSITGHGMSGGAADWVGFGDDCGVAAGLSAALRAASGRSGLVGDAIADPLTGIHAARIAWDAWRDGRGGRYGISMRGVAARALDTARKDRGTFDRALKRWRAAEGRSFPPVRRRTAGPVRSLGADNGRLLRDVPPC